MSEDPKERGAKPPSGERPRESANVCGEVVGVTGGKSLP
jgi:hypothetical protein